MTHRTLTSIVILAAVGLGSPAAFANNDPSTSYRAATISAPSVGESTNNPSTVAVNQGRVSYSLPIAAPPGRAGLEPGLSLVYTGRPRATVLGAGWDLSVPSIRVRTSGRGGQPNWGTAVRYLGIDGEELVEITDDLADQDGDGLRETLYRAERDTTYQRYVRLSAGGWRVDDPSGFSTTFGASTSARVSRAGMVDQVVQWLPERRVDRSENELVWVWSGADEVAATAGTTAVNEAARYLSEMRWGCQDCSNAASYQTIQVDYEELPEHGFDFGPGFLIEWEFGVSTVRTATVVSGIESPVRFYDLTYDDTQTRRLLEAVSVSGSDGASLPDVEFGYTQRSAPGNPATISNAPSIGMGNGVQPVDVDLDGAVDLIDLGNVALGADYFRRTGASGVTFAGAVSVPATDLPGVSLVRGGLASAEDTTRDLAMDVFDLDSGAVFAHDGAGAWALDSTATLPVITAYEHTVRIDVNADGYVDLLDTDADPWQAWLDDGSRTYTSDHVVFSAEATPKVGTTLEAGDDGVLFGDINGDGLVDCVLLDGSDNALVFYGRGLGGFGWLAEDGRALPHSVLIVSSTVVGNPPPAETSIVDMDGDGFGDLVSLDSNIGEVRVWRRIPGAGFDEAPNGTPFAQTISPNDGCRVADWDSDGLHEVLCSDGWNLYDWAESIPFQLAEVDNGLGLVTRIEYETTARIAAYHEAAGMPWTTNVSMALPVVSRVEVDDSRGNVLVTDYDYRDPHYEADHTEDHFELTGFRYISQVQTPYVEQIPGDPGSRVEDPQDPGMMTRMFYDVGDGVYMERGMLDCEEEWERTATPSDFSCDVHQDGPLTRRVQEHSSSTNTDGVTTLHVDAEERWAMEGAGVDEAQHTRTEFEYDEYGNRTVVRELGTDEVGDERMVVASFVHNLEDWMVQLPRLIEEGDPDGASFVRVSATCFEYDDQVGMCAGGYSGELDGNVGTGLQTRVYSYTDDDVSDGTPGSWELVAATSYTSNGLPEVVTDAEGIETERSYDADFALFPSETVLDPDGLDLRTQQIIDPRHGQMTSLTGPDGNTTRAEFDALGRFTTLIEPGDTAASPTLVRSYLSAAPTPSVRDVEKDGTADGLTTYRRLDGAGRLLCERREAVGGFETTAQHEYSARGALTVEYLPSDSSSCDQPSRGATGRSSTRPHDFVVYDALVRPISLEHRPSGGAVATVRRPSASVTYDEEDTNPLSPHAGTPTTRWTDGRGRITSVVQTIDDDGDGLAEDFTTQYGYGVLGLTSVTDPLGVVIYGMRRDSRGRVVWTRDANRGTHETSYDNADRIVHVADDRGHSVRYEYDATGRVTRQVADEGGTHEVTRYAYDVHPMGAAWTANCNTAGRLAQVVDPSGTTTFCYDERGRVVREFAEISALGTNAAVTRREFDAMGRLETLTYPDGTKLHYAYDAAARPSSLTLESNGALHTLVTGASYNAAGGLELASLSNGVDLEIDYDDRLRPVARRGLLAGDGLDLEYEVDGLGNVLEVIDGVGMRSASYVYDDWGRMIEASGDALNGEVFSYAYDLRGNMVSRLSTDAGSPLNIQAMAYGDAVAVHALTELDRDGDGVSDEFFAYDASGNLESDGTYAFRFDALERLRSVEDLSGTELVAYTYDYSNRRVASAYPTGDSVVHLPSANAEIRRFGGITTARKFLTFAGMSVGVFEGTFVAGTEADHIFAFASDHLGSPAVVFDIGANPSVIERCANYPYGEENSALLDAEGNLGDYLEPSDPGSLLSRRFQGRDIETQLPEFYDFGARIYRSDLGRFLTADSIVPDPLDAQSWNRYAFVDNNPLSRVDPSGHAANLAFAPEDISAGSQLSGADPAGDWEQTLDRVQLSLDVVSVTMDATGVGATVSWVPDIANGVISLGRGDYTGAALSAASAIPVVGAAANAARIARAADAARTAKRLEDGVGVASRATPPAPPPLPPGWSRDARGRVHSPDGRFAPDPSGAPRGGKGTTRHDVPRNKARYWNNMKQWWDEAGYGDILSPANKERIGNRRSPIVDDEWIQVFPGDAGLKGEIIESHHIGGLPIEVPLPKSRHKDAHMPGGFGYNPGGPGMSG